MKAFLLALVLLAVCVLAAMFVLEGETVASSDRYQSEGSVRLDANMRSNLAVEPQGDAQ